MAYDGIIASSVVWELSGLIEGSRITKIYQAERDEILLVCNKNGENYKLLISCNPANPRIHLSRATKENPMVAPPFCMVLRKYIQGGKIRKIEQAGFDRIIFFRIDTFNELGDPIVKTLAVEIMGRHSNIILIAPTGHIYDAIKHVDERTSSVREILPARPYVMPPEQDKISPDDVSALSALTPSDYDDPSTTVAKLLINKISGFSPLLSKGICYKSSIDPNTRINTLTSEEISALRETLVCVSEKITSHHFSPFIIAEEDKDTKILKYCDFHCIDDGQNARKLTYSSVNLMLDEFYTKKDTEERLRQKKASLVKCISNAIARTERKISIYEADIKSAENFDELRIKGELITANVYRIKQGDTQAEVENYYSENYEKIIIDLDENLSPAQNAQVYFKRYRKKKSTCDNAARNLNDAMTELSYLRSVETMLANCTDNSDIAEIREELAIGGYISSATQHGGVKKKSGKSQSTSKHLILEVSDGYEVWVGKNNLQNDLITTKLAAPNDIWFHVKNAPGSHVILRTSQKGGEFTKASIEDAARLAAEYSSHKSSSKVEVDFTRVKYVKKPSGARPGKVIFTNQKSIITD